MRKAPATQPTQFAAIALLLIATLNAACATSKKPTDLTTSQIRAVSDAVAAARREDPNAIAWNDYTAIAQNAFGGRSEQEVGLLVGRLYLDAASRIAQKRPSGAYSGDGDQIRRNVKQALSQPRPVTKFSKAYFDGLLADTMARVARDRDYECAVTTSAQYSRFQWDDAWDNYRCIIDGFDAPISQCRMLVLGDMVGTLQVFD